jgi:hypothetical protein
VRALALAANMDFGSRTWKKRYILIILHHKATKLQTTTQLRYLLQGGEGGYPPLGTVTPHHIKDLGGEIADVRYNRGKGYSRKYTIGYITNARNKHNTQCDYIKVLSKFFHHYFK